MKFPEEEIDKMRKHLHALRRRALSALLAAVMMMSLAPMAFAAVEGPGKNDLCPGVSSSDTTNKGEAHSWRLTNNVTEATCHDKGSVEYRCYYCKNTYKEEIPEDSSKHIYIYTDNEDGKTHSGYCRYHQDKTTAKENHEFQKGRCIQCGAVDYNSVAAAIEKNKTVYVAIGEENAKLSMEEITLTAGNADITKEYNITYAWFDKNGANVGNGSSYTLPAAVTEEEADYAYTCVILASPKSGASAKPISATCNVSVLVRDLIVARATLNVKDDYLDFDDTSDAMSDSIYDQIYDAVYDAAASGATPDYIIFDEQPESKVGRLNISSSSSRKYSFSSKDSYSLEDIRFELGEDGVTGTYTINFKAWDTKGKEFPGVLTIYVEKSLSDAGVLYSGVKGGDVALSADDFERFWLESHSSGSLEYVVFKSPSDGNLYYDRDKVDTGKDGDEFYFQPTKSRQMDLDEVVFTPRKSFTGTVTIDFTATGKSSKGKTTDLEGTVTILFTDGDVEDISYRVPTGGSAALDPEDFLSVYKEATGSKTSSFYIQLLSLPESGALYLDRTSSRSGTQLKDSNKSSYQFHYSSSQNKEIEDLTYVPGSAAKDSASYAVYDSKGEPLYVGTILFERDDLTVEYTASSASGVTFKANDFRTLLGSGASDVITAVSFSAPSKGSLYYNYVGGVGTPVTSSDKYYTTGTTLSVSSLTYVPASGQKAGEVTIPFTAYDLSNNKVSGEVKITVPETPAKPDVPTNPSKPVTPVTPVTFSDVPNNANTEWYYTAVTELAGAGIINGYEDGTFRPANEVTYGQALKLIMMAAGYEDLSGTGSSWAKGFLDKALEDGLLSQTVNLDRKITRSAIAEIAYKALKLDKPTIASPFYDSTEESALALYETGIITGEERSGKLMFFGSYSITRREMAVIIWRMNNYMLNKG